MKKTFLLLVILLCSGLQIAAATAGYKSTGSIRDLYEVERLLYLRTGVKCLMFSSYDRTGGNDDGFSGTYSKLRVEDGNSVVAEMTGPGCIHRIWMPHAEHRRDGVLGNKGEHIKIYLDGSKEPVIDVPLEDVFAGKFKQFPKPLVGEALGGFYCYVPISYRNGCKVVFEGTAVKFYQINYSEFDSADGVVTFSMQYDESKKEQLAKAVEIWSEPGKLVDRAASKNFKIKLKAGQTKVIELPEGGNLIRGISFDFGDQSFDELGNSRIVIKWDGAGNAAVDLPLDHYFGQVYGPDKYESLFVGKNENGYYNYMPMAYGERVKVEIVADKALTGKLTVFCDPFEFEKEKMGYFHGFYHEAKPAKSKVHYPWLRTTGRGHYFGIYMVTEGPKYLDWLPVWLEGDDSFLINDELVMHGTGSEDYFNCGWYAVDGRLNNPGYLPLHGFPIYESDRAKKTRAVAYRWHVSDAVPYDGSIQAMMEHGPDNDHLADYSSAVYFYDTRAGTVKLDKPRILIEAETTQLRVCSGGFTQVQKGNWGATGGSHYWWTAGKVGDVLEIEFEVGADGLYQVGMQMITAADYGRFEVILDGEMMIKELDMFAPKNVNLKQVDVGKLELEKGTHRLTFMILQANPKAIKGNLLGLDYIELIKSD